MSVREQIEASAQALTASERKVASVLLADYPFAGLHTINELADRTGVSAPSITRFIQKIGCNGFQDFQRHLIGELREGQRGPVHLKQSGAEARAQPSLADYADTVARQLAAMGEGISQSQFDQVSALLSDSKRNIYMLGGRISDSLALFFSLHMRQIRSGVFHIPSTTEQWPDYILRMRKRDVVVLIDFRRYQSNLADLARLIAEKRQANVVLITDQWLSPISRYSAHVFALPIDAGTGWDTATGALALLEALFVRVSEADWDATRHRIESWDALRFALPGNERDGKARANGANGVREDDG
jgi:DNA-binding MurR/RpiR family transcriptional regulator